MSFCISHPEFLQPDQSERGTRDNNSKNFTIINRGVCFDLFDWFEVLCHRLPICDPGINAVTDVKVDIKTKTNPIQLESVKLVYTETCCPHMGWHARWKDPKFVGFISHTHLGKGLYRMFGKGRPIKKKTWKWLLEPFIILCGPIRFLLPFGQASNSTMCRCVYLAPAEWNLQYCSFFFFF